MCELKSILLIEDNADERYLVERLFRDCEKCFHGEVTLSVCSNWTEAESAIALAPPDVVIADLRIAPLSVDEGIDTLSAHAPYFPPIVAVTGYPNGRTKERCMDAGAAQYLSKSAVVATPALLFALVYIAFLERQLYAR